MNTPTRVAVFVGGLAAAFALAFGVGAVTGPVGAARGTTEPAGHGGDHTTSDQPGSGRPVAAELPGGLMVSQDGYTLDLSQRQVRPATEVPLQFRILGPDGRPVTRYTTAHGKDLHLIAVRRDLTDFQHVHPQLAGDGTWSVPVDLPDAGAYRVFADFTPADRGENLTLGADLFVSGHDDAAPLPTPAGTAEVDGYTVTLDGALRPGEEAELTLSVSKDGRPVTDLQPYLEAYGHLVALRDRDLAYLHVHPAGHPGDGTTKPGPGITFYATVPSAGDYRLFLDFQHEDWVRTAAFTVRAAASPGASGPATTATPPAADKGHRDHGDHGG